jgi:hypothetical protein
MSCEACEKETNKMKGSTPIFYQCDIDSCLQIWVNNGRIWRAVSEEEYKTIKQEMQEPWDVSGY